MDMEESTQLMKLIFRHAKHALDAGGFADANLDMRFLAETRPFIYRRAFHEDPAHGVYGLIFVILADLM